jgi:hypothetical protein
MTEHTGRIEYHKRKLKAEKWGDGVQYILAQNGYVETAYNNNRIEREYHRGPKQGQFEVIQSAWSPDEVMLHFTG